MSDPADRRADVAVVGAGLAGLACAVRLCRGGMRVRVLEATGDAGGVARSRRVDGFLFEAGPNTVPANSPHLVALATELGIGSRIVTSARAAAVRWLWFGGRLVRVPSSPLGLFATPLLSLRAKLAVAREPLRKWRAPVDGGEPTLFALLTDRFGAEAAELFGGAVVRGTSGGDVHTLGAWSAFPILEELLAHGGIVRGMFARRGKERGPRGLVSFPGGFGELAAAARDALGDSFRADTRVETLREERDEYVLVDQRGAEHRAHAVVLAIGARAAASLLAPLGVERTVRTLASIRHAGLRVVHLGFAPALTVPEGFGFLVPTALALDRRGGGERRPQALGVLFASNLFAGRVPPGASSVTMFFADDWARGASEAQRAERAAEDLALALGSAQPRAASASWCIDWPGRIPQYEPGHARRISAVEAELDAVAPRVALVGSYTHGASVDRVIARGLAVAERLLRARETPVP